MTIYSFKELLPEIQDNTLEHIKEYIDWHALDEHIIEIFKEKLHKANWPYAKGLHWDSSNPGVSFAGWIDDNKILEIAKQNPAKFPPHIIKILKYILDIQEFSIQIWLITDNRGNCAGKEFMKLEFNFDKDQYPQIHRKIKELSNIIFQEALNFTDTLIDIGQEHIENYISNENTIRSITENN